jgi:hypothetical protein
MTIKELKKMRYGRRTGNFKQQVVQSWRLGFLKLKDILVTLRLSRHAFRCWVRWEYYHRVMKYQSFHQKSKIMAKKIRTSTTEQITDIKVLQDLVQRLEAQLAEEQLRNQALNIMLDIGKEDYGVDLRKKLEAKLLKK